MHPDWNADNIPFAESTAARRMVEQSIPFVNNSGVESGRGAIMNRLSIHYRAMVDASAKPVKLDRPIKLQWPSGRSATNTHNPGTIAPKPAIVPQINSYCVPVRTAQIKTFKPVHACCTTCTTKKHISQCLNTCDNCDETKDLEHVYVLSPNSSLSNDTSPAMLYVLPPQWQESTASTDTRDVGEGGKPRTRIGLLAVLTEVQPPHRSS